MEHLIKQYSQFLGEMLHLEIIFPKSFLTVRHLISLTQQHFYPGYPVQYKNQQEENFCWFFLLPTI